MSEKEKTGLTGAEQLVAQGAMVLKAENDRMEAVAIARPRDEKKVKDRALDLIKADPEAAASAFYSIPFKEHSHEGECTGKSDDSCPVKEWVEGIGIEGAREIARLWGNNSSRVYISDEDDEWVYVSGVFLDLETNVRVEVPLPVSKVGRYKSGAIYTLYPARLAMAVQAGVSKAARNAIVQAIPRHISRAVYEKAKEVVLETGELALPKLLEAFAAFNVGREKLEGLYHKPLEELSPDERRNLRGLFTSFREHFLEPEEFFAGAGGGGAAGPSGEGTSPADGNGVTPPPSAVVGSAKVTNGAVKEPSAPAEEPPLPNEEGTVGTVAAGEKAASEPVEPSQPTLRVVESPPPDEPAPVDFDGIGI